MILSKWYFNFIFLSIVFYSGFATAFNQQNVIHQSGPWKGNAILGNGKICVVYSDDPRITAQSGSKGIRHLYYDNYTADYVSSTNFNLFDKKGNLLTGKQSTGLKDFFCTSTSKQINNDISEDVTCYVHQKGAVVISLSVNGNYKYLQQKFYLHLRKKIKTDKIIILNSLRKENNIALATWSNKNVLLVVCQSPKSSISLKDSVIIFSGKIIPGEKINILLIPSHSIQRAKLIYHSIEKLNDIYLSASKYWEAWMNKGSIPQFANASKKNSVYIDFYKRTLYSVKAANLNGQIPADITGQFMTNNMPQLYPRDAMMCARVFILTNHLKEAKQIIKFWTNKNIPHKSEGEFYARYDAYAKAVDAGSGARYDEPEWDSDGYLIQLLNEYHIKTNKWLANKEFIYNLADFLVNHIDDSGLLYEGGIVEWTGYLPATNMICASALKTASAIARKFGDNINAEKYLNASERISSSLYKVYDKKKNTYVDLRFHGEKAKDNSSITKHSRDSLFLWDTSVNFGVIWGFPNNQEMENTNRFILNNTVILNGGVEYFEAEDKGLTAYGSCAFFFTTAASAEYQTLYGSMKIAEKEINWMIKNSNVYGLMPERIYHDGSDCSEASPLSWCNAEFAAAVLTWNERIRSYK